ncbi:hypothetical protein DFH09DRAFT_1067817 [Mycena vulgaris]|nr:hypothetical protein DFH09DRAFT_1067817 [Mycena vulgaris]
MPSPPSLNYRLTRNGDPGIDPASPRIRTVYHPLIVGPLVNVVTEVFGDATDMLHQVPRIPLTTTSLQVVNIREDLQQAVGVGVSLGWGWAALQIEVERRRPQQNRHGSAGQHTPATMES